MCCYTTANSELVTEDKFGKSVAAAETSGDNSSLHLFFWTVNEYCTSDKPRLSLWCTAAEALRSRFFHTLRRRIRAETCPSLDCSSLLHQDSFQVLGSSGSPLDEPHGFHIEPQLLMEPKPTSEFWVPKSLKTQLPCPGYCKLIHTDKATGIMNKDLRFAKKGQPPGFGHGRRHSCLGYVTDRKLEELCSKCWMHPDASGFN